MRFAVVPIVLLLGVSTPAVADADTTGRVTPAKAYGIHASGGLGGSVTRIGAFRPRRDATIRRAQRVFGPPSSKKLVSDDLCVVDWRRLKLRIYFANFGWSGPRQTTCSPTVGKAQSFTARSSRFKTWRGLRIGAPSSTIPNLHPNAGFVDGAWWLKFAISPFGPDESEYASVYATVSKGRVTAIKGWVGAAGE